MNQARQNGETVSPGKAYFDEYELAERLNMSVQWLRKQRDIGGGIPFHKFGSRVRYAIAAILEYEARTIRQSTSDPGRSA
jgi:hypothetical protein